MTTVIAPHDSAELAEVTAMVLASSYLMQPIPIGVEYVKHEGRQFLALLFNQVTATGRRR
jgi:hypothetical protein